MCTENAFSEEVQVEGFCQSVGPDNVGGSGRWSAGLGEARSRISLDLFSLSLYSAVR